ncbi:BMP/retinoic acid-inducible neural-specific protein 3-like isoform 2-T2 [Syngnathus typhle]
MALSFWSAQLDRNTLSFLKREFGRWKVNNLASERRDVSQSPLPLTSEFIRNIRLLGRRPSVQTITDNLIKKYGTHFLLSATLGGEEALTIFVDKRKLSKKAEVSDYSSNSSSVTLEALHQLAASYFIDRESTLRKLHHIQIASTAIKVTETRTGPLGCSNYDNLDSVSSVLVQSPENKVQLQGLQTVLPDYLREDFVQAALSYIACNGEGRFVCKDNDCWCSCDAKFPQCNCPYTDIQAMEESLERITQTWAQLYKDFEESDEFKGFHARLPQKHFLNISTIQHLWSLDTVFHGRYELLENSMRVIAKRAERVIFKLFSLSKRCHRQPQVRVPRERSQAYWLSHFQSLLYCSENNQLGAFSEELHSCSCRYEHVPCHLPPPCAVGEGSACAECAPDNHTRCGGCNQGFTLLQGLCKPMVADSTENYLGFETDLQDLELGYLLQRSDRRLEVHAIFISNDMRLNSWFDPSWRKRMLLTLKSNKYKSNMVHMLLGISLQVCLTKNSTLEPVLTLYINPFGGSHSESWYIPVNENGFPDWQATKLDLPFDCYNWTLTLGNKWKTFFETIHVYLRSRITAPNGANDSVYYEPLEVTDPGRNLGYMKINSIQVFGYSMHFDPEAIRDLILQLDYPYTQGSQDTAMLQLLEIRDRVNRLSPQGQPRLDLFACLLRHRLKLTPGEVARIHASLQDFGSRLPNSVEYESIKLCS